MKRKYFQYFHLRCLLPGFVEETLIVLGSDTLLIKMLYDWGHYR